MYIAIKNTEHKGVYKEKDFNKKLYETKGISHRKFKSNELEEALKWAGVKDLKVSSSNNKVKQNNVKPVSIKNLALEIIEDYKTKGCDGVCITTKSLGEIILKLNGFDLFLSQDLRYFNRDKESLVEHFSVKLEEAKQELERYYYNTPYPLGVKIEIIRIENNSKVTAINEHFLNLDNFWARPKTNNPFEAKNLMISRIVKLSCNSNDFWESYSNFVLSLDEIVSIQPLTFDLPKNKPDVLNSCYSTFICERISRKDSKSIEKMFKDFETERFAITKL